MQALADSTDCSVALGAADRAEMVYIDVCQRRVPLILRLEVGAPLPMPPTSIGPAYFAGHGEAHLACLSHRLQPSPCPPRPRPPSRLVESRRIPPALRSIIP